MLVVVGRQDTGDLEAQIRGSTRIWCSVSRYHDRTKMFWFAFHPHQKAFLGEAPQAFAAFGCRDAETIFFIPFAKFEVWLPFFYRTESEERSCWHVKIRKAGKRFEMVGRSGSEKRLVVLDEAQVWPEIFPRLRSAIDEDRGRKGRFLLLGSVAPSLMREVSESLAGRLSVVRLTPVTLGESPGTPLDDFWLVGGFPEPLTMPSLYPRWQRSYLTLLAQRDLPEWGFLSKPGQTERLFKMLAALHGQPLNASQLGKSLGLSHNTVRGYIDFLEGAFLIRVVRPYATNVKKRLVKSPRIYWTDSGLLHALLGVEDREHLLEQPWVGASWEGFVIQQILDSLHARGNETEAYYFRTSDGYEADLVLRLGRELWAIEVKLTSNPRTDDIRRLDRAADLIGAPKRALISRTPEPIANGKTFSCNLESFLDMAEKAGG